MQSSHDLIHLRFERLLRDYAARIRVLVQAHGLGRYGVDPADVEQEVRIRLWKALERDRNGLFHASYIQKIVASVVIDAIRRARVRETEPLPEEEVTTAVFWQQSGSPEQNTGDDQDAKRILACLEELPERRRAPLALHLQGFALAEIAQATGVSVEAARKLVTRGMEALKARLRELGYGEYND